MGYADGYYFGQGRIICDTSTMSVGDKVRVRSVTDNTKIWDQTVATVGTALKFTVPCFDYYKICLVQTISDEEVEVGGVKKTVDYGQTLFINVLNKTTLGGIQGILNAHQETELLNIGDEVDITVNGSPWTMQIAKIDGSSHYVELVSKYVTNDVLPIQNSNYSNRTTVQSTLSSFYSSIIESDRNLIKEKTVNYVTGGGSGTAGSINQKVWLLTRVEVDGTGPELGSQFPIFSTQASKKKYTTEGIVVGYMLAGCTLTASAGYTDYISTNGIASYTNSATLYMLPCFRLTADV